MGSTTHQLSADLVRNAVASPSTCSASTAATLRDLLIPKLQTFEPIDTTAKTTATAKARATKTARTTTTTATIHTKTTARDRAATEERLTVKERSILATEIINATLKALSAAISAPTSITPTTPRKAELKDGSVKREKTLRRSISLQSPLQQRSLNRVASSPSLSTRTSRASSTASTVSGQRAVAECAHIAFGCLRGLQTSKTAPLKLPELQLESGMSALIGKLISLGLDDLALRELRILKKRLDSYGQTTTATTTAITTTKKKAAVGEKGAGVIPEVLTLSDLLDFGNSTWDKKTLNLVVTTQLHVLKLIATTKKPSHIKSALSKLNPSAPSSPIVYLTQQASDAAQTAKAARQLETLSQLLLSLCPSISTSEDAVALESRLSVAPEIALQLQTMAFQTRLRWWKACGHRADVGKDILEPFSRCMAAFARRTTLKRLESYKVGLKAFKDLEDAAKTYQNSETVSTQSAHLNIYKTLGSLAQDAGENAEAMDWIEKAQNNMTAEDKSGIRGCSVVARLAALKLSTEPQSKSTEALVVRVLEELEGPLKGESSAIDELLNEVAAVRRATITLLSIQSDSCPEHMRISDGLRYVCESLIYLCPKFCLRYLGKAPDPSAATKQLLHFEKRRLIISKLAYPTVDACLYLIKTLLSAERMTWELLDSVLQDCLTLLEQIDTVHDKPAQNSQSHFVKVSHIYYARYMAPRAFPKEGREFRALRRSIECVRRRSPSEKSAAILISKLERLAEIYQSMGRLDDSFSTLTSLRDEVISSGALMSAVSRFPTLPSQLAWASSDDAASLARAIGNIVKLQIKRGMSSMETMIPLPPSLTDQEQGAIMECGLDTMLSNLSQHKGNARLQSAAVSVATRLLDLYSSQLFPIRRLRVIAKICLCDPELYNKTPAHQQDIGLLLQRITDEQVQNSKDADLMPYLGHLKAMLRSIYELQRHDSNMETMKEAIAAFSRLLDSCKNEATLKMRVDSVSDFLGHLQSLSDFLDMKGYGTFRIVVLRLIISINELLASPTTADEIVKYSAQLSTQYLELGYSGKAGLTLDKTNTYIGQSQTSALTQLMFRLSYAEYYLAIGNVDKCEEYLSSEDLFLASRSTDTTMRRSSSRLVERNLQNRLISEAYSICSLIALSRGSLDLALQHAKTSVRLLWRCWTNVEQEVQRQSSSDGRVEKLAGDMATLNLSTAINPAVNGFGTLSGSSFWSLIYPLFRSLSQLSSVFAHHGFYQETMYYAEQARKMVALANSEVYTAIATAQVGQVFLRGGVKPSAMKMLSEAQELCAKFEKNRYTAWAQCLLGGVHRMQAKADDACAAYELAVSTIDSLMLPSYITNLERIIEVDLSLEDELAQLTIIPQKRAATKSARATRTARTTTTSRGTRTTKAASTKGKTAAKSATEAVPAASTECPELSSLRGHVIRQKAHAMVLWRKFDEATELLEQSDLAASGQQDAVDQHIGMARQLLEHSLELMTSDAVYSMLQDSTISFPAITSTSRGDAAGDRFTAPRSPARKTASARSRSKAPSVSEFADMLQQAHDHLLAAYGLAVHSSSTAVCNTLSVLLSSTVMILSAAGQAKGKSLAHLGIASCSVDMARILAFQREQTIVQMDPQDADDLRWPQMPAEATVTRNSFSADLLRFQKEYIDIIPSAWTTISISLSESHDELCITKYQAGHNPFVLRLPLGRHLSRDADEEVFGFDEGRAEMREISKLADESAHSGATMDSKAAKKAWWTQRMNLDLQLKDLLENIERVWLGGFRGIFSQHTRRPELLTRFSRSFHHILDKHLPSRQKTGRSKTKTAHITLDSRILELFIGLGEAPSDEGDFEEQLTDLLYFVIDVLQFHGERNAYDEIDFDSIAVETLDILRIYHSAVRTSKSTDEPKHTILILDKALHCFPWESLPCMDGLAVSRLPSLECLRDNIIAQKAAAAQGPQGHYIDRTKGVYILNPDGDLKTTQDTFEDELQNLSCWDAIAGRAPSESEFESHLADKDLMLYFGHGSGAQYIRSKTIKRLDKCAVTMLMGCSSGVLTYTNEFQLYGPVMDYMFAGAPAVVATLWDITDRDVDRFAKRTFEEWGLFEGGIFGEKKTSSKSGKKGSRGEKTSLVEAVSKGREACMLRYLTAAAVVVYGVPVYFK